MCTEPFPLKFGAQTRNLENLHTEAVFPAVSGDI